MWLLVSIAVRDVSECGELASERRNAFMASKILLFYTLVLVVVVVCFGLVSREHSLIPTHM